MSDLAIQVENLSKRYRLGPHQRYRTLRESLTAAIASPLRRWRDRRPMTDDGSPGLPSPVPRPSQFSPASSVSGQPSEDGYIWALKDVSFSVKHGEVLGIIGRNGAGKSTLLKILSRITKPTEGRAVVNGRVGSLLEVGTGFHPELTGRENVYLNGAILGMKRAELERTFDEIVAFAEVEKFIDTPVKHYSSGMYVRLAFAVAAHLEPEILLVDEVLAVGDAEFQRKCLGRMSEVTKEGRTVLFVSHNMASVARLCTSGLWLADGHCAYWGSSPDAINRYLASGTSAGLAHVDLRKAPGWDSQRRVILTSVTTRTIDGRETSEFRTGEGMRIQIGYSLSEEIFAYCQINILNVLGERVMTLRTTHAQPAMKLASEGILECIVADLRLVSGDYMLMLEIGREFPHVEWLDCVPEAIRFHVSLGDYLGGVELTHGQGMIAQRSSWSLL